MNKKYILYNNILWEPQCTFTYTGEEEEFTLNPGTYLFVANGAKGGDAGANPFKSWGGTTYGILDLDRVQTFYACVGGNGDNATPGGGARALGGYNGGGNGGLSTSSTYYNGAAGGGASDIRLHPSETITEDHFIPEGFSEVEYIKSNVTQRFNTEYIHKSNTRIEFICNVAANTGLNYRCLFGSRAIVSGNKRNQMVFFTRFQGEQKACWSCNDVEQTFNWSFRYGEKIKIVAEGRTISWYDMNGTLISSITSSASSQVDGANPMYLLDYFQGDSAGGCYADATIYSVKIFTGSKLDRYYIPFVNDEDPTDNGLYDLVKNTFCRSLTGDPFTTGDVVEKTHYEETIGDYGLLTRIIVGSGGGGTGAQWNNDTVQDFTSFGGGPMAGWANGAGDDSNNIWKRANQTSGYSFGIGRDAEDKISSGGTTWSQEGQGGGGGGWFGGWSVTGLRYSSSQYSACNGGGGSSYVLTADSYKPENYMYGYINLMPSLYMRNVLMLPYQAFEGPSIEIYKLMTLPPLVGDRIVVPYTGEEQSMVLIPGRYRIKCYGGDGAVRYRNDKAAKGGYAEGIVSTIAGSRLYYHVGNSSYLIGMGTNQANHDAIFNNRMIYQSSVGNYSSHQYAAMSGGGSVDVRTISNLPQYVKASIPDTYSQLDYIQSDGSQYIDLQYNPLATDNFEADCYVIRNDQKWFQVIFGTRQGIVSYSIAFFTHFDGNYIPCLSSGSTETRGSDMRYNERITIKINNNVASWYDSEGTYISGINGAPRANCTKPLFLFDLNNGGSADGSRCKARLYGFKITNNNLDIHWYVPCINKSNPSEIGMYDIISRVFYPKKTGNAFTYGSIVDTVEYDIRKSFETESKLSRFIVAGGGGGQGSNSCYGGDGGGSSGNSYNGSGYGTNNGPGTQNSGYLFETGMIGQTVNSGFGGSGGYGWYGGYGTVITYSGDIAIGGSGGSGYVLTEDSFKPIGYIPDESFYLTDTVLTTGGNPVRGMTRIVVEPLTITSITIIARDNDGYKGYNKTNNEWYLLPSQQLSTELFDLYGEYASNILSDVGLLFPYKLYAFDKYDTGVVELISHVLPIPQNVLISIKSNAEILGVVSDYDVDSNSTIDVDYSISGIAENRYINIDATFTMEDIPTMNPELYMVQFETRNRQTSYYYPTPPEKTIDDLDLLYVGHNVKIPSRYKPSIGGFMPDGTTAITTVASSTSCSYKRDIYSATLINDTYIRFTKFSLIENKTYVIRDIPISGISTFSGKCIAGSLLIDDNNMYLFHSRNAYNGDGSGSWYKTGVLVIPIDPSKTYALYMPSGSTNYVYNNCFGQAFWYSSDKIITCSQNGFMIFDIITKSFTGFSDTDDGGMRSSFAVGKYNIMSIWNDDRCNGPRVYNKATLARISSGLNIPMGTSKKCTCYADGKFYVAEKGHIYVINDREDHALIIDQDIPAPFSTIQPQTIDYTNGLLYITFVNSPTVYVYSISTNVFRSISLPFAAGNLDNRGLSLYRPVVYKGFFFIEQLKLFACNASQSYKYKVSEKGSVLLIQTNSDIENKMTYDNRFITVDSGGVTAHTGYIDKTLHEIDPENHIYESDPFISNEYQKFISCEINIREEE